MISKEDYSQKTLYRIVAGVPLTPYHNSILLNQLWEEMEKQVYFLLEGKK